MPAAPAATNIADSNSGMVFSGIEMPAFETLLSCNTVGRVGGLQVICMLAGPAAKTIAASGSGMGCSGIEMPAFEIVLSCDTAGRVGGVAGNSNACWACCQKNRGKWQWDVVFRHRNACF